MAARRRRRHKRRGGGPKPEAWTALSRWSSVAIPPESWRTYNHPGRDGGGTINLLGSHPLHMGACRSQRLIVTCVNSITRNGECPHTVAKGAKGKRELNRGGAEARRRKRKEMSTELTPADTPTTFPWTFASWRGGGEECLQTFACRATCEPRTVPHLGYR